MELFAFNWMLLDEVLRAVYSWQEAFSALLLLRCAVHDHLRLRVLLWRSLAGQPSIACARGIGCIALDLKGSSFGCLWHYLTVRSVHLEDIRLIESHVSIPARFFWCKGSGLLLLDRFRLVQGQDLVC